MDPLHSPLDELADAVQSALAARRARLEERIRRVENALLSYRRATESVLAREFAREHGFALPAPPSPPPSRAAELLLAAVRELPELEVATADPAPSSEPATPPLPALNANAVANITEYPWLSRLSEHKKIVVIGAISGRDKATFLPSELAQHAEWIDTEREGAHAVGNLPQRIRQGRVAAVIILDRAVQHKHTEAVMASARESDVPIAFAGQGGKASLLRAVEQLESTLTPREPVPSVPPSRGGKR